MAKTAKKSTAKKTRAKSAAVKKTNNSKATSQTITAKRLYKFNIFAGVANLVFAVLSVIFISKDTLSTSLTYATKDGLGGNVLGPAYKTLATLEIRYLLAAIFVISAIFSLLLASRLRKTYEAGVNNSTSGLRWFLSGITLALTLELTSWIGGVRDLITLKLVAGLVLATAILAWMNERENKGSKKHYTAFGLSLFTGVMAWLPLAASLVGTALYGITNFSWYVYTLSALVLLGFISIAMDQYRHARDGISAKGYLQLEGKYLSTDFLIKFALFIVLIFALHK